MNPENKLYNDLRDYKAKSPGPWWHMTRIESSTVPGIPDLNVVSYKFGKDSTDIISQDFWLELKAQETTEPRIRPAQFAWMLKRSMMIGSAPCWVLNRHPKTKEIAMWRIHEKVYAERKSAERIAILDIPTFTFNSVEELVSTSPERFQLR